MEILSQYPNLGVYAFDAFVLLIVGLSLFIRYSRSNQPRCPKCGESRSKPDGWTDVGVPGQDGTLVYRRCECCQHRWGIHQPETGPSPYKNIP